MRSFFSGTNKFISVGIIIALLVAAGLTVYILQQQQNLRQEAAVPDPSILATVDGLPITRDDLIQFAGTMYKTAPTDTATLQNLLSELVEKRVLETAAKQENITATNDEIQNQIAHDGLISFASDPVIRETSRDMVLKKKIELRFTKAREAFTVGFWIPPEDYGLPIPEESLALVSQQRRDATAATIAIENRLKRGEEPLAVASAVTEEFPSLSLIMAVNGFLVAQEENTRLMTDSVLYSFQAGRSSLPLFQTLFSLQTGSIAVVQDQETNAGGIVVKVVGSADGQFDNYSEWYGEARSRIVTVNNNL